MKKALNLTLFIILVLTLITVVVCEKSQITEIEKAKKMSVEKQSSLEKSKDGEGWDCYGYAVWRATRDPEYYERL